MKETIKQLKKELERIDNLREGMSQGCWVSSQLRINRFKTEAKLQTLQEICEEIEKWRECSCDYLQCNYCVKLNELLERLQGENK